MRARVSKWGNSLAIRLPKVAVEKFALEEGAPVELNIEGDRIEILTARPRYRLKDLLAQITPGDQPEAIDVAPVGEEAL